MSIVCPHCGGELMPEELKKLWAQYNGSKTTDAKAAAAKSNGAKGGRPRKFTKETK